MKKEGTLLTYNSHVREYTHMSALYFTSQHSMQVSIYWITAPYVSVINPFFSAILNLFSLVCFACESKLFLFFFFFLLLCVGRTFVPMSLYPLASCYTISYKGGLWGTEYGRTVRGLSGNRLPPPPSSFKSYPPPVC